MTKLKRNWLDEIVEPAKLGKDIPKAILGLPPNIPDQLKRAWNIAALIELRLFATAAKCMD